MVYSSSGSKLNQIKGEENIVIDISSYEKADVLVTLYNHSKPLGLGFLHFTPEDMTALESK